MKKGGEAEAVDVPKEDGEDTETLKRIRVEHGEAADVEEEVSFLFKKLALYGINTSKALIF